MSVSGRLSLSLLVRLSLSCASPFSFSFPLSLFLFLSLVNSLSLNENDKDHSSNRLSLYRVHGALTNPWLANSSHRARKVSNWACACAGKNQVLHSKKCAVWSGVVLCGAVCCCVIFVLLVMCLSCGAQQTRCHVYDGSSPPKKNDICNRTQITRKGFSPFWF